MNDSDRKLAEDIKTEIESFGLKHAAKSKRLGWWGRMASPLNATMGIIGGSSGVASLMMAFIKDDDLDGTYTFEMGWPQVITLVQAVMLIGQAALSAQKHELRSIRHNDTAGDCAELINDINGVLADERVDEHDIIQAMERFKSKKTEIEQGAPHL